MSPVSRGRKRKKGTGRKGGRAQLAILPEPPAVSGDCDCGFCSGEVVEPQQIIRDLVADAGDLVDCEDPLDAEITGAAFLSIGDVAGEGFEEALVEGMIPACEAEATAEALALLSAVGSVAEGRSRGAARAAADRLAAAGVRSPAWMGELAEPVKVTDFRRVADDQGLASFLSCSAHRAGRSHVFMMSVNHLACGAAEGIHLLVADGLPDAVQAMRALGTANGVELVEEDLDPAEFRWAVENALDARAVHDEAGYPTPGEEREDEHDGVPEYPALARLLRERMNALPALDRPKPPHAPPDGLAGRRELVAPPAAYGAGLFGSATPTKKLPAKRRKAAAPAPIYQVKVGLRGAKPPIWRRLEVPADISLAWLHEVIQVAFCWDDSHLHVFETPYGDFGDPDDDLGRRAAAPVTLEQVASGVQSKIRYTYDFGDDWQHDILVEKVLAREQTASYPRCTGGRRAAPPEDCGGVWGYANLLETLGDPDHPAHEDMLEWLGLEDPAGFDPSRFDANALNEALSKLG